MFNLRNLRICGKIELVVIAALCIVTTGETRNFFSPHSNLSWSSVPVCLSHEGAKRNVKQFEMVEFGFELPATLQEKFADQKNGINPFDPEQLNILVVFSKGTISDTIYGFYYTDYLRDESTIKSVFDNCPEAKWIEQPTQYPFRVRFATGDTGTWKVNIRVKVHPEIATDFRNVWYSIDETSFNVVSSTNSGFLELTSDRLHFRESGKLKSFFMLGQNIAWTDGPRFRGGVNPNAPAMVAGGYLDVYDWTKNLAQNGGNTIRVVNVPWTYEYEWDTVGVYNMARAWELDQLFKTCEASEVKMVFCMEHGTYTEYPWYEEHLTWTKHPYNRFIPGVDHPEDFLTDKVARVNYRNKLRYFFARWGYSNSLGIFQILSEMDNWTFGKPATQLEDSKELQRINLQWHNEMLSFAKQQVKYRPLLTSTSYGDAPRDFSISAYSSPFCDVVCPRHCYFTQRHDNLRRWEEVNGKNIAEPGIHNLFPRKAAIFDEMGFGSNGADPNDIDANNDVTYHNALWSTAFSGTAGAGLYWWRWGSNEYREQNFPALRRFFTDVDMSGMIHSGHWEDANRPSKVSIETFYIANDSRRYCAGWVHNASYWWGNISQNVKDRNGKTMEINSRTGDDANISTPTELHGGIKFQIHDLANGTSYYYLTYSTRDGGGPLTEGIVTTNIFGTAKIFWSHGHPDYAFKLESRDNNLLSTTMIVLPQDTVVSGEVIPIFGNHPMDTLGTFRYAWDFGNGIVREEKNTNVIFDAGSYHVQLRCTDAAGKQYVITQQIFAEGEQHTDTITACKFAERKCAF